MVAIVAKTLRNFLSAFGFGTRGVLDPGEGVGIIDFLSTSSKTFIMSRPTSAPRIPGYVCRMTVANVSLTSLSLCCFRRASMTRGVVTALTGVVAPRLRPAGVSLSISGEYLRDCGGRLLRVWKPNTPLSPSDESSTSQFH
jgi:hypothetical protein